MIDAAEHKAAEMGHPFVIAVVDESGMVRGGGPRPTIMATVRYHGRTAPSTFVAEVQCIAAAT